MYEIIEDEIRKVYPGKGKNNEHQQTLVYKAIEDVGASFDRKPNFVKQWITLFAIFSDQRALTTMQNIYTRAGLPIPERLKPVVDAL